MSDYITVSLSNGLFNAGIIGLYKLLELSEDCDYQIINQEMKISKDFFLNNNIAKLYLDLIFENFERESRFYNFIHTNYNSIEDKAIRELKIFTHQTPITIGEIYKKTEFLELISEFQALRNVSEKRGKLLQIQQYLLSDNEFYKYLVIGDITRSIFSYYFGTFAYLNISQGKSLIRIKEGWDFEKSLNEFLFGKKLKDYIKNIQNYQKGNSNYIDCFQCRESYSKTKAAFTEMKFLNDFVDDPSKKKSAFWLGQVDSYICPLCAFIYALMPFGFIPVARETLRDRLFVNLNNSIESLITVNQSVSREKELTLDNNKLAVLNNIVEQEIKEKLRELDNIEIIIRECYDKRSYYSFNIIGKDILTIIKLSRDSLSKLLTASVKIGEEWINVFNIVLNNVLNYQSQWLFLNQLMKADVNHYILSNVFNIQINQNSIKEGAGPMKEVEGKIKSARISGIELREYFGIEAENKLRSYIYKLVNALGVGNKELFLDTVVRMYSGINKEIPNTFINLFAGDERYKEIGYAYLLGLKSKFKEQEEEKNE